MLENVKVAQIKKFKKQSAFIFEFWFWEDPSHQSTGPQPIPKCISLKCIFPKCIYPKCISAKCIRLACLLSFASLFFSELLSFLGLIHWFVIFSGRFFSFWDAAIALWWITASPSAFSSLVTFSTYNSQIFWNWNG